MLQMHQSIGEDKILPIVILTTPNSSRTTLKKFKDIFFSQNYFEKYFCVCVCALLDMRF